MKRTLYVLPAVSVIFLYGMLALLAGGFASFQLKAWLIILLPALSAVLLLAGHWWGFLPGSCLGGTLMGMSLSAGQPLGLNMGLGVFFFVYYLIMGLLCFREHRKQK